MIENYRREKFDGEKFNIDGKYLQREVVKKSQGILCPAGPMRVGFYVKAPGYSRFKILSLNLQTKCTILLRKYKLSVALAINIRYVCVCQLYLVFGRGTQFMINDHITPL